MVKGTRRRISLHMIWIALLLAVQLLCSLFFILDIFSSVLGLRAVPIAWQMREMLELGAALGLVLGLLLGTYALYRLLRERNAAEERLRRASGVFSDLMAERFVEWG